MRCLDCALIFVTAICTSVVGIADEPTIRERVSSQDMEALVESLISDRQIVTDLKVRLVESQTLSGDQRAELVDGPLHRAIEDSARIE